MAAGSRWSARPFDVPGEAAANAGNLKQQHIAKFDLGSKHRRRRVHAGEKVKPYVHLLDRAQGIPKGAITDAIQVAAFPHCSAPNELKPTALQGGKNNLSI